jgi:hypothetical protein
VLEPSIEQLPWAMGVFVIACPQTGRKFATGVQVERDNLADTDATTVATSFCPYCRQIDNGATVMLNRCVAARMGLRTDRPP